MVSNTVTIAIAPPGTTSCGDPANPLSALERSAGSEGFVHVQRVDSISDVTTVRVNSTLDKLYARFVRPQTATFAFDPYLSYPPAGACLVHQTGGDANVNKNLRGTATAASALTPKPILGFNNGVQDGKNFGAAATYSSITLGGTVGKKAVGIPLANGNAKVTVTDAGGSSVTAPLKLVGAPSWPQRETLRVVDRTMPLQLNFLPGDAVSATAILLYSYSTSSNATVEVQCLAPPGASTFTIPPDTLANLPPTYRNINGSYTNIAIGALNAAVSPFTTAQVSSGLVLFSSWLSVSVVVK